jgi:predicted dehydrogenase
MNRRQFLGSAAAVATFTIVPRHVLAGARQVPPSEKLNIACIGVGGQGGSDVQSVSTENIVALCDVNAKHLEEAAKKYPQAKTYRDWRKLLDQKDIDAVIVSTTDHTHAFASVWAMRRG